MMIMCEERVRRVFYEMRKMSRHSFQKAKTISSLSSSSEYFLTFNWKASIAAHQKYQKYYESSWRSSWSAGKHSLIMKRFLCSLTPSIYVRKIIFNFYFLSLTRDCLNRKTELMFIHGNRYLGCSLSTCVFFTPAPAKFSWNLDQQTNKYIAKKNSFEKLTTRQRKSSASSRWLITVEKYSEYFILSIVECFLCFLAFAGSPKIQKLFSISAVLWSLLLLADWKMEMCRRRSSFSIFCFLYLFFFLEKFMQFWKILKSRKTENIHEISACSWNAKNYFHNKQNQFFGVLESASLLEWISDILNWTKMWNMIF